MKYSKLALATALITAPSLALAGMSEVVSLGKGRYMIGGTSATVYGNVSKLQVKAMGIAQQHCTQIKPGTEAVLENLDSQKANAGWGGGGGFGTNQGWAMGGGANRAEVQIVFTCQAPEVDVAPVPSPIAAPIDTQAAPQSQVPEPAAAD